MKNTIPSSPFGQTALALSADFERLEQLSGQILRLDIESDNGLEKATELLRDFSACGEKIGSGIQDFARALDEARSSSEKAAQAVSERAMAIQARHEERNRMLERFEALSGAVTKVSNFLAQMKKPQGGFDQEEAALLKSRLPEIDAQLETLVAQANQLRTDARDSSFRGIEKNADSLGQTLVSARKKLASLGDQPSLH